jgi:hypothetical protein
MNSFGVYFLHKDSTLGAWVILSQKNVKSHIENHVNDEYYECCFEICLISTYVLKGINPKLIIIVPNPLLSYKFTDLVNKD